MEQITTLNKCPHWNQFLFYHEEKSKYEVVLPDKHILYLSNHTIYCLKEMESSFCSSTRNLCKEGKSPNYFDLSRCEYSDQEIIEFFFLVTFPEDISYIDDPSNSIMLSHLYAPKITHRLIKGLKNLCFFTHSTPEQLKYFWKIIALHQITGLAINGSIRHNIIGILRVIPYTAYKLDNTVNVENILGEKLSGFWDYSHFSHQDDNIFPSLLDSDTETVVRFWSNGDEDALYKLENSPNVAELMTINHENVAYLEISAVIKNIGLSSLLDNLLYVHDCEEFVTKVYQCMRQIDPPKITYKEGSATFTTNHYTIRDYNIVAEAVRLYW